MVTGELYFCHLSIEGSGQVATIFSALGAGTNALVLALLCADVYWNGFFLIGFIKLYILVGT